MNFVIQRFPNSRPINVHIDRIKRFEGELPRCWRDENLEPTVHLRMEARSPVVLTAWQNK